MDWAAWWAAHDEAVITLIVGAVIGGFLNWVFFLYRSGKSAATISRFPVLPVATTYESKFGRLRCGD
jgi:hypothetical protein